MSLIASIKVTFHPPPPPDGLPNYRPNGGHTYQIRDDITGKLLISGTFGPDKRSAWNWAFRQASKKGFTHYTTPDNLDTRPIPQT